MNTFQQPASEGFYQRMYQGEDAPEWTKDYWDGEKWYYVKGGMVAKTQQREWREITKEGK